ncbi:photosystem II reaction center W protein, chloroplastic [Solanum lycopersicum]|uniref:PSII 6.1 kDa protein n=1 Tax=Solanum lycopersicum TaxID=4081 RepID=A0A3Q7H5N4_SOLLC|nr:photosystem II reaction center W protein, chloroplastic [Solanum lycopersicum]
MASSITACTTTSLAAREALLHKASALSRPSVLGLPSMRKNVGRVKCSMEREDSKSGICGSLVAATLSFSPTAMALVDERMSTEGTGLPFGLSNNLLGWILFGVFGLVWSLYTVYTSSLDEDEDSAMSL